ncbi:hypothetical protein GUJ93_ZPchr0010g11144 [Zizania palustris]|uniref:Uncharacterized protein n=1 Tax=Zizania palustris TaxID=103762 RepID=A0A8J6BGP1_ZIZPA|nr:hypothetical protein GUJ93_ZPchr0010g11144 [Zizania palustris]
MASTFKHSRTPLTAPFPGAGKGRVRGLRHCHLGERSRPHPAPPAPARSRMVISSSCRQIVLCTHTPTDHKAGPCCHFLVKNNQFSCTMNQLFDGTRSSVLHKCSVLLEANLFWLVAKSMSNCIFKI